MRGDAYTRKQWEQGQKIREPDLETALKRMVAMLIGRITAYGEKWRRWFAKQQHQSDPKVM